MTPRADLSADEREALLKRWLRLMVERSSLDELSARPLAERIKEFELMLEAAGEAGIGMASGDAAPAAPPAPGGGLTAALDQRLAEQRAGGTPFSVALVAGGPPWRDALERVGDGDVVHELPGGVAAIVLPGLEGADARAAVDRLRVAAWRELGSEGRLAEVGVASCPADGATAEDLIAAAESQLIRVTRSEPRDERLERAVAEHHERIEGGDATRSRAAVVTPLPLPSSRTEPRWGPWAPRA